MKEPVTQRDIADRLGVQFNLVRSWQARGKLPPAPYRIGRRPAWEASKIDAWWIEYRAESKPGPAPVTTL